MQNPMAVMPIAHKRRELFVLPMAGARRRTPSDSTMVIAASVKEVVQKVFGSGGTTNPKPAASTAADAIIAIAIQSQPDNPLRGSLWGTFLFSSECGCGLANMAEFFP